MNDMPPLDDSTTLAARPDSARPEDPRASNTFEGGRVARSGVDHPIRYEGDPRARLERDAMAWPPATWERPVPSAWRDDVIGLPDPFLPFPQLLESEPESTLPRPGRTASYRTLVREVLETFVLTALIFVSIRLVVQNFRIEGESMMSTLRDNQYLLVNKLSYGLVGHPQRGDIIVFEAWGQDKDFIKRVIGLPGDKIEIRDSNVYVNDTLLEEPYLDNAFHDPGRKDAIAAQTLGPNQYFVLGDNRDNSTDSRTYGPLPGNEIVGKAWITYWPVSDIGFIPDSRTSFASTP